MIDDKWAASWAVIVYANSKDSGEPVNPRSLAGAYAVR